jgi:hypothetical protein
MGGNPFICQSIQTCQAHGKHWGEEEVHEQTQDHVTAVPPYNATNSTSQTHTGVTNVYSPTTINSIQSGSVTAHRRMVTDHVLQNMEVEMNTLIATMQYQLNQVKESKVSVENPECILGNETALSDPLSGVW